MLPLVLAVGLLLVSAAPAGADALWTLLKGGGQIVAGRLAPSALTAGP